jgi:PleD family two-component response regulator
MSAAVRALRMGAHDLPDEAAPERGGGGADGREGDGRSGQLREANRSLLEQLEVQSLTDALTDVPNRRAFDLALPQEIARARRHGPRFSA